MTKRITLALAMVGLSASAFAGAPGNQVAMPTGVNLVAPDSVGVWSFGIEALYARAANNEYQYGQLNTDTTTNQSFKNKSVSNDYQFGGTVDIAYMFPGSSRDVKLSYTHIDFNDSSSTTLGANQTFSSFAVGSDGLSNEGDVAKGSQDNEVNAVDLVFGQWIRIGQRVDLHPFGGLRYADIDTDDKGTYTNVSTDPAAVSTEKLTSDFQGIGPRAGMDAAVHLGKGFSIVGTMAGSLLIGSNDSKLNIYNNTGSTTTQETYKSGSSTTVVPELDARIGVDYMYAFTPETSMNVQLGWQVVNYFDVTDTDAIDMVSPNTVNSSEDFGYQGPYLRLQVNLA